MIKVYVDIKKSFDSDKIFGFVYKQEDNDKCFALLNNGEWRFFLHGIYEIKDDEKLEVSSYFAGKFEKDAEESRENLDKPN